MRWHGNYWWMAPKSGQCSVDCNRSCSLCSPVIVHAATDTPRHRHKLANICAHSKFHSHCQFSANSSQQQHWPALNDQRAVRTGHSAAKRAIDKQSEVRQVAELRSDSHSFNDGNKIQRTICICICQVTFWSGNFSVRDKARLMMKAVQQQLEGCHFL